MALKSLIILDKLLLWTSFLGLEILLLLNICEEQIKLPVKALCKEPNKTIGMPAQWNNLPGKI